MLWWIIKWLSKSICLRKYILEWVIFFSVDLFIKLDLCLFSFFFFFNVVVYWLLQFQSWIKRGLKFNLLVKLRGIKVLYCIVFISINEVGKGCSHLILWLLVFVWIIFGFLPTVFLHHDTRSHWVNVTRSIHLAAIAITITVSIEWKIHFYYQIKI